jgi:hypothetical protein
MTKGQLVNQEVRDSEAVGRMTLSQHASLYQMCLTNIFMIGIKKDRTSTEVSSHGK